MPSSAEPATRLHDALVDIDHHLEANIERGRIVQARVRALREAIGQGRTVAEALRAESSPSAVELITANMKTLEGVGSELRAALAVALRDEGITMAEIADLFGVTPQRISALLRQKAALERGHDI